ncbi:response regulator [bacterium]|nr:response regulator [bacterium]
MTGFEMMKAQTVLIVEDETILRLHLSKVLQKNGFIALSAKNGYKALELINRNQIDLIISDIEMPDMDGYALLDRLRENPMTAKIPFFFLSCRSSTDEKVFGLKQGVHDYITKPVDAEELIQRVKNTLKTMNADCCSIQGSAVLSGKIKSGQLNEILQFVSISNPTGCLNLNWSNNQGKIWLQDGKLHLASTAAGLQGEPAIYDMLGIESGDYYFLENSDPPESNIGVDIVQIMIKASIIRDTRFQQQCEILKIRYKTICRRISEIYLEDNLNDINRSEITALMKKVEGINIKAVDNMMLVTNMKLQFDQFETELGEIYTRVSNEELTLYTAKEDIVIEAKMIAHCIDKFDPMKKQKLPLKKLLDNMEHIGDSEMDFEQIDKQIIAAFTEETQDHSKMSDFSFLQQSLPSISTVLKAKQDCRIVLLSEFNRFFTRFSRGSSWAVRFGFIGLYSHLFKFYEQFSRIPMKTEEIVEDSTDPKVLVLRIPVDQGYFIYFVGLPLISDSRELIKFTDSIDVCTFVQGTDSGERMFNREILLKILSQFPEQRTFLTRDVTGLKGKSRPVFQILSAWESRQTIEMKTAGYQSVMNLLKSCKKL